MKENINESEENDMKKIILSFLAFALIITGMPTSADAKTTTELNKAKLTMYVGQTYQLKLKNTEKNAKIRWVSSKKTVALVSKKGKITAKKAGTVKITAKLSRPNKKLKKYVCTVKVTGVKKPSTTTIITPSPEGNLTYQSDVTNEMTKASYWIKKCDEPDTIMLDTAGIQAANEKMLKEKATNMNDLLNHPDTYNGTARKESLAAAIDSEVKEGRVNGKTFYHDGTEVSDPDTFFSELKENILGTETSTESKVQYALCVKRADMKMAPVSEPIGWSAADPDDEFINSSLNVNEPLIIEAVTADGKFYWGRGINCTGWVEAEHFAVCDTKEEWTKMWTGTGEDILVVTTSQITLAASNLDKKTSKLELMLGTTLPLVSKEELPKNINERGTWYNYIVYVPTRDEQGKFVREIAMIGMHNDVSIGYLPFTKRNLLKVAFSCLGDRYGWGGMLDAMDCSLYIRSIYKCFGFELPRNTTWQSQIPSENISLSEMTDDEKTKSILSCEPGTLLMFPGHIMMYLGEADGKLYVISDLGSLAETEKLGTDINIQSLYCVAVNSLDVRRRNANTWLTSLTTAIRPWKYQEE